MIAIFDGGPLDGKEDYDVPDDQVEVVFVQMLPLRDIPEAPDPTWELPVVKHFYDRTNEVGSAGRFIYRGTDIR